jgi:hypothetical protein
MLRKTTALAVCCVALVCLPAAATTIAPPRNLGELARMSRAVVLARASTSWVEDRGLPVTLTAFELVEPVGGARTRAVFVVECPGGTLADRAVVITGSPRFEEGRNYLLFLARGPGQRWRPQMMAYGLLEEVPVEEVPVESVLLLRPLAEADEIVLQGTGEAPETYYERRLVTHLREVLGGAPWDRAKVLAPGRLAAKSHTKPPLCEFQRDPGDGLPLRNFGYETGGSMSIAHTTPGQVGIADGGVSAVQQGVAAWTNHPDSVLRYLYGGSRPRSIACSTSSDIDQGGVVFNDPCNDIPDLAGCAGTLAFGGSFYNPGARPLYDGEPWHDVSTPFVVVNNGSQCVGEAGFRQMMTHELGHTQGFGHHTDPNATMAATLRNDGRGAALAATDRVCASYAYHTFLDVPHNHPSWAYIEAVENVGITGGCGAGNYCPSSPVTRQEMAIFLLRAASGGGYTPPSCTPRFNDVPCSSPYAAWINQLAARGITGGCGANNYCPTASIKRQEMAIFLLRSASGPSYVPPPCTAPLFTDVPCSSPYAPWINELFRRGIASGCSAGSFCPGSPVTRDQMAVLVARTFSIPTP